VAATLRIPDYAGRGLRDVFGGQIFPGINEDGTLTLTLGSHDFFWLRLRSAASNPASPYTQALPILSIED
jgi:maltose alpha-D-glucosyltransferase/alpha-amylase